MAIPSLRKSNLNLKTDLNSALSNLEDDFETLSFDEQEELDFEDLDREEQDPVLDIDNFNEEEDNPDSNEDEYLANIPLNEKIESLKEEDDDKFIDKKNKKIIPIGGNKSKVRAQTFDKRKNLIVTIKLVRILIMAFIVFLFAIGIKNTYFPVQIYTPNQIAWIAQNAVGDTGFPIERGKSFAKNFVKFYLEANDSKESLSLLNYFYTGNLEMNTYSDSQNLNRTVLKGLKQKVLVDPVVLDGFSLDENVAGFKITTLVSDSNGDTVSEDGKNIRSHWMTFHVNVFYDIDNDTLSIHKNSPTLIPNYRLAKTNDIPKEDKIGNGEVNSDMLSKLIPTIDGFVVAYSKSSVEYHNDIVQYIPSEKPLELISGFGGDLKIAKNINTSIRKTVYNTDDTDIFKVDVYVDWIDNQNTKGSSVFTSRYIMTIQRTADNVYLVTKFSPYYYVKGNEE